MFVVVPSWSDAEFYRILAGAKCMEKCIIHEKFATFFEDTAGKRISASFSTSMFILSGGDDAPSRDYSLLIRALKN